MNRPDHREASPAAVTAAVLLAGGESRRLGADKTALRIGAAPLVQRGVDLLRGLFPRVAVSVRVGQELDLGAAGAEVELLPDRWSGSPLGAIATALDHFAAPVFVLACDLPFADAASIGQVLDAFVAVDVALPVFDDMREPLHAVYGPACLAPMQRLLERGGHRIVAAFPDVRVAAVPFASARPFFNVNHPEDYEEALRREVEETFRRDATRVPRPESAGRPAADEGDEGRPQPALVALVGKSDSGKTTFLEKLLPELRALGLRVATVKHDVHGFEIDTPGKDSWRHGQAGADAYAVAGPDKLALIVGLVTELPLAEIVRRYFADYDLVVAEGYKRQAPHRIEIFRRDAGHDEPLCRSAEIVALVTDDDRLSHPQRFDIGDGNGVAQFIAARLADLRDY